MATPIPARMAPIPKTMVLTGLEKNSSVRYSGKKAVMR